MGKWANLVSGVKNTAKTGGMVVAAGFGGGVGTKLADRGEQHFVQAADAVSDKLQETARRVKSRRDEDKSVDDSWAEAAESALEKRKERNY